MKLAFLVLLISMLGAVTAHAQVSDRALDADYKNCMGADNDARRAVYCGCVRDEMRGWSTDDYNQLVTEAAAAKNAQSVPAKLQELAKKCMSKALD